jgi:DNA-binding transcriptional LysR family regulator
MIKFSKDSIARAKSATHNNEHIIRIGSSPITPTQFIMELWPQIHESCPDLKFQFVPFENTPENAREIMGNFGQNIDLVLGIYEENLLRQRKCAGLELVKEPIRCAVSIHHRLAKKEKIGEQDLFDENLMIIKRGWNSYVDRFRDDITKRCPQIKIVDFDFYNTGVFNQCENSNNILMAIGAWKNVHPLLKIIPVDWPYVVPTGLYYSSKPSNSVCDFVHAVAKIYKLECSV